MRQPGDRPQAAHGQPPRCSASRIAWRCCSSATLPRDLTEKNIRLFASEVLPALQRLTDKEYAGMQTRAAE